MIPSNLWEFLHLIMITNEKIQHGVELNPINALLSSDRQVIALVLIAHAYMFAHGVSSVSASSNTQSYQGKS